MSTRLDAIQEMLPRLSPGEKAQLLQWVARDLGGTAPGIDKTPGVCGGEARVMRTRVPVWTLAQARRLGVSEATLLASYPTHPHRPRPRDAVAAIIQRLSRNARLVFDDLRMTENSRRRPPLPPLQRASAG